MIITKAEKVKIIFKQKPKLKYTVIIKPILICGCKAWTTMSTTKRRLGTSEIKYGEKYVDQSIITRK